MRERELERPEVSELVEKSRSLDIRDDCKLGPEVEEERPSRGRRETFKRYSVRTVRRRTRTRKLTKFLK